MRRMPCRRYKHQDSTHELAMNPLNLSKVLSMVANPLASHPDQVVLGSDNVKRRRRQKKRNFPP